MDKPKFRGLRLPADSRVPDPAEVATISEYDDYFTLDRRQVTLREWTEDCMSVERELLRDLPHSGLSEGESGRVIAGLLIVHRMTLEQWSAARPSDAERDSTTPAGRETMHE